MSLRELVESHSIVVCAGSGGVGKTTTAAVLAMEAARRGRRAVVVTIDPAKRLADTLGIGELTNEPKRIDGDWPGELHALMLDTKTTFDNVVMANCFLKDLNDFPKFNETYGTYFKDGMPPARATVQVARLPRDVLVEVALIAVK